MHPLRRDELDALTKMLAQAHVESVERLGYQTHRVQVTEQKGGGGFVFATLSAPSREVAEKGVEAYCRRYPAEAYQTEISSHPTQIGAEWRAVVRRYASCD